LQSVVFAATMTALALAASPLLAMNSNRHFPTDLFA
jgi:hypothetical protein